MKIKIALIMLAFGYVLDFVGAWMKITHQAPADFTLTIAMFLKALGVLLFVFFILSHPKVKEFLEYDKYKDSFK